MSDDSGERILELGSGNGIMVREMPETVGLAGYVTGVDNSEAMNVQARELCDANPKVTFQDADLEKSLPFAEHAFDVVTSTQCLCFLANVDALLAETYRVLKPGPMD
jgi:arsenite methyltransferase